MGGHLSAPSRPDHPAFAIHRALLEKWRGAMDLVGPGPVDPHFDDAVAAVRWLDARGRWADLGSGAGFPGVALAALHPEAQVTLVERRQKRAAFLDEVVAATKLPNARVWVGDAARLPPGLDGLVSRAFLPPAELLPLAARLLRPGGSLVLLFAREEHEPPPGWARFHVERYTIEGRPRRAEGWTWARSGPHDKARDIG